MVVDLLPRVLARPLSDEMLVCWHRIAHARAARPKGYGQLSYRGRCDAGGLGCAACPLKCILKRLLQERCAGRAGAICKMVQRYSRRAAVRRLPALTRAGNPRHLFSFHSMPPSSHSNRSSPDIGSEPIADQSEPLGSKSWRQPDRSLSGGDTIIHTNPRRRVYIYASLEAANKERSEPERQWPVLVTAGAHKADTKSNAGASQAGGFSHRYRPGY